MKGIKTTNPEEVGALSDLLRLETWTKALVFGFKWHGPGQRNTRLTKRDFPVVVAALFLVFTSVGVVLAVTTPRGYGWLILVGVEIAFVVATLFLKVALR